MKHSEIKNRIIETASQLFYDKGYNSTGINEIISESGVAKATLYNHFRSKEEICLAYLQYKNNTFMEDIEAFTKSRRKGKSQVLALFDFLQEFFEDRDFNGCWCLKTVAEIPKDNELIRDEIQRQKMGFITLIKQLVVDNLKNLKMKQVDSLSRRIYLLYESAIGESHLHKEDWPIREAKTICSQMI